MEVVTLPITTAAAPPKTSNACSYCRSRKVKCNPPSGSAGSRCQNCIRHDKECVYPPSQRKRGKRGSDASVLLERRLAQMEEILHGANVQEFGDNVRNQALSQQHPRPQPSGYDHSPRTTSNADDGRRITFSQSPRNPESDQSRINPLPQRTQFPHSPVFTPSSRAEGTSFDSPIARREYDIPNEIVIDREESIISPHNVHWEHHGPRSWLSICSQPGIRWVSDRTGDLDFAETARGLTMGWTRRLKLDPNATREKAAEPDAETAWKYTEAYFEECHYALFGIVQRPVFETRLRAQLTQSPGFEDDPSWYALRNAVYATGCRIVLSKDPSTTFGEDQARAWRYFENALSVHTELLYTPTGLPAVQALAIMSLYAEGLGSTALEYMLCSSAARLAQSKGLHRQPARAWNLPESEILHRNCIFWAIYCCDKAIANRSGRPSAIDDNDISCQIPVINHETSVDMQIFVHAIRHAQISSQISKTLTSVSASGRTTREVIETVAALEQQLRQWRDALPNFLQLGRARNPLKPANTKCDINVMYIQYAYYGSLMAIHTIFVYPWITAVFPPDPGLHEQILASTDTVAEAARNIILATKNMEVDAASPAWLAFYFPMVGLINLFVSIVKSPTSLSARSDVALMDIAAGHFGHIEFITSSEMAFPFARDVAALARKTVKVARAKSAPGSARPETPMMGGQPMNSGSDVDIGNELDMLSGIDFDLESWNVFSSVPIDDLSGDTYGAFLPH